MTAIRKLAGSVLILIGCVANPVLLAALLERTSSFVTATTMKIVAVEITLVLLGVALIVWPGAVINALRRNARYLAFVAACALLSLELIVRLWFAGSYPTYSYRAHYVVDGTIAHFPKIYAPSEYAAYGLKRGMRRELTNTVFGYTYEITTDGAGFRRHPGMDHSARTAMVLGDSVTFGTGVDDDETYPAQLQRLVANDLSVHNLGVAGYGPAEYYVTFLDRSPSLQPEIVIVGLYIGNDLRNLADSRWTGREDNQLPVPPVSRRDLYLDQDHHLRSSDWILTTPALRYSAAFVYLGRTFVDPLRRAFDEFSYTPPEEMTVRILRVIGDKCACPVVAVLLPAQRHYRYPATWTPERLAAKLRDSGVHVIDAYPVLRPVSETVFLDGSHLTAEGNGMVATAIYDYYRANDVLHVR